MSTISFETMTDIAQTLIDNYIECFGVRHCIALLMEDCELTDEQLIELNFDKNDIAFVKKHINDPDFDWGNVS